MQKKNAGKMNQLSMGSPESLPVIALVSFCSLLCQTGGIFCYVETQVDQNYLQGIFC